MTAAEPTEIVKYRPWLHVYAVLLVLATFALVAVGGNVTSIDAGLSVPEGWTTGGYFSPLAPLAVWWDDLATRWEHSHRLLGTLVGLLTIGLVGWLWLTQRSRPWLRYLGLVLLGMVIVQGVMGAARVDLVSTILALIHGVFGQVILATSVLIAAATSRVWLRSANRSPQAADVASGLRLLSLVFVALLVGQLVLGASVRHFKAGLAIPDFPTSYGRWIPPFDQQAIDQAYMRLLPTDLPVRPATTTQVAIHFAHRVAALVITMVGFWLVAAVIARLPARREVIGPVFTLIGLLFLQITLGAFVIWSGKYPATATAHQATGAALLAVAVWLAIRIYLVTNAKVTHQRSDRMVAPNIQGNAA